MCRNLARLYALWQCEPAFKFTVESFSIFRSLFLALAFAGNAQNISFGLNMNILGINARKINPDNILAILSGCFYPRRPILKVEFSESGRSKNRPNRSSISRCQLDNSSPGFHLINSPNIIRTSFHFLSNRHLKFNSRSAAVKPLVPPFSDF